MVLQSQFGSESHFHGPGDKERLKRMMRELERGFGFLEGFDHDRVVTIFGSAQTKPSQKMYKSARDFGRLLAEDGITVVSGGGPGIMEAVNRGAFDVGGRSVGINIFLKNQERRNNYVTESIGFYYFFVRKVILAHIAQAYVYYPGGFGTLDEFFELMTLIHTRKMIAKNIPVVLVGKDYWQGIEKFLTSVAEKKYKTLTSSAFKIWTIVDSPEEAFELVKKIPKRVKREDTL